MAAVAAIYTDFKKLDVEILAISVDSVHAHKTWQEQELSKMVEGGVLFPMLSDAGGEVGKVYGVYSEKIGKDVRGRFLIDPDGIIQSFEVLSPPVGRNATELIRQIQAYQYVRKHKEVEVCPAGWHPGKPTLKPGPDLVCKVWTVWKPS